MSILKHLRHKSLKIELWNTNKNEDNSNLHKVQCTLQQCSDAHFWIKSKTLEEETPSTTWGHNMEHGVVSCKSKMKWLRMTVPPTLEHFGDLDGWNANCRWFWRLQRDLFGIVDNF